jgi:hypothetical protein
MRFAKGVHAGELEIVRIVWELWRREFAKFWRELARPVTFFDVCSPRDVSLDRNRRIS